MTVYGEKKRIDMILESTIGTKYRMDFFIFVKLNSLWFFHGFFNHFLSDASLSQTIWERRGGKIPYDNKSI